MDQTVLNSGVKLSSGSMAEGVKDDKGIQDEGGGTQDRGGGFEKVYMNFQALVLGASIDQIPEIVIRFIQQIC